ncbi:enoyl-CoA hydratase/isomerase family protein [Paraburkholderia sp. BL21I4N1]|uniref:enoyl-CoA hydratase/isomerase family protein n=1 Tax=Paraburkholderia sp. BL21I4N1 TaxID=1938801 RepID=UPI000CFB177D|nr:enoyl-CoA hydratase/isomerase family protein [Paraburkholderia sp. BL21I4N1]PQV54820.1 enoyl-CoA hydratase/carnithine racemase [Paraburkholderia sp. BL21I4N1]
MNTDELILTNINANLVQLTIKRPPANALSETLIAALMSTFSRFSRQSVPPGVVLTGAGEKFFCAGGDINEVANHELAVSRMEAFSAFLCQIEQYPGPLVCAVNGYAVGAGFEIVLHADYVVASPESRLGFPEINHGLLPAAKGMRQAASLLGYRAARSLLFSGALISAEHALTIGAVDAISAREDVLAQAIVQCGQLCDKDRQLFGAIKQTLRQSPQMTDDALLQLTLSDLRGYLDNPKTADARAHFLTRNKKVES